MTPDPMQLLRASNPVGDCGAPGFNRLLDRLDHLEPEPSAEPGVDLAPPSRARFFDLRSKEVPRNASARRALAALVPVAVALAVAVVAIVTLHGSHAGGNGPSMSTGSVAFSPGQARGRVVNGSMHQFSTAVSGAHGQSWSAEWFRTTAGQICVQAGRQVGTRLGYVDIDGTLPHDGRFRAWPRDTAVDARCINQPARGGIALTVVERVADSGYELPASGACTAAEHQPCPSADTTTLFYGVLGSDAAMLGYGTEGRGRAVMIQTGPGQDGGYIQTPANGGLSVQCLNMRHCAVGHPTPAQLVHPGARAFALYSGRERSCALRPGRGGVMAADCRYGLTLGPSPYRLTAAEVRTPVHVTTRTKGKQVQVAASFHTRVASSRVSEYELQLSTPDRCPPSGGATTASLPLGGFHDGQLLTVHGTASVPCSGTYHGAVIVQPLVGHRLTVGRFSFKEGHGS